MTPLVMRKRFLKQLRLEIICKEVVELSKKTTALSWSVR